MCRTCNQFFGDELELRFARDSFEAILRYQQRAKTPKSTGPVSLQNVEFAMPERPESPWSGVRLVAVWSGEELQVEPLPQVALRDSTNRSWTYLTLTEIDEDRLRGLESDQVKIFAKSEEERDILLNRLNEVGISFKTLSQLEPMKRENTGDGSLEVIMTFRINRGLRRCVAKYAFNFLAFTQDAKFVLDPAFDITRRFIRYGERPNYPLVQESFTPILRDDHPIMRQTDAHLITVNWTDNQRDIVGQVSLFNYLTYHVSLGRGYEGLWRSIRAGVAYSWREKVVRQLFGVSSHLVP